MLRSTCQRGAHVLWSNFFQHLFKRHIETGRFASKQAKSEGWIQDSHLIAPPTTIEEILTKQQVKVNRIAPINSSTAIVTRYYTNKE
jgi:hypothetical protein